MDEIWRWIGTALLAALWLKATGYNVFLAADRINRRSREGPRGLRIIGSLCGIGALVLAPAGALPLRLLLLPLALIPDLAIPVAERIATRHRPPNDPPR